ncbi:FecR family protein [Sphingobacterium sp. HJSM2_6]|uniref:FecR family protein n=1 Tax=Sphingobacterium sp. HJSM2_6 TaxID=3366264 RepID=UPI003BE684DC
MEEKQIQHLIQKYLSGKASPEEIALLEAWYLSKQEDEVIWDLKDDNVEGLQNRLKANIWKQTIEKPVAKRKNTVWSYLAVASIVLVVAFIYFSKSTSKDKYYLAAKTTTNQTENRHLTLPDSSIVILRPGSELLISESFGEMNREVELIGEAYFDVTPNKEKPFIIRTDQIKTTVLGTAFSIQANPNSNQIEVLVDHGKVRVENEQEVLGIITTDQKLIISDSKQLNNKTKASIQVAKNETQWKEEDMHFESMPFGLIVNKLERRYQVTIDFLNTELEKCHMSGVFQGTENLEEVLTNLCLTSNTSYKKIAENHYQITGESCFN